MGAPPTTAQRRNLTTVYEFESALGGVCRGHFNLGPHSARAHACHFSLPLSGPPRLQSFLEIATCAGECLSAEDQSALLVAR